MRKVRAIRYKSMWLMITLALAFAFALTACGTGAGTGTTTGAGPTPTPTMGTVKGYGTSHGCPSDIVVNTAPAPANVVVRLNDLHRTIGAHRGDVIEFEMPFGHTWNGPTSSQGVLQLQTPSGYAWTSNNACIWRFVAQSTGTMQVMFEAKAICKPNQMCPQYIVNMPFTIEVK